MADALAASSDAPALAAQQPLLPLQEQPGDAGPDPFAAEMQQHTSAGAGGQLLLTDDAVLAFMARLQQHQKMCEVRTVQSRLTPAS